MRFELLTKDGHARRGIFHTPHGDVQTPCFMNVATAGAIKGALSARDLETLGCQVMLCNTYHLHVRPGEGIIRQMGGLRGFTGWKGPDSTGLSESKLPCRVRIFFNPENGERSGLCALNF